MDQRDQSGAPASPEHRGQTHLASLTFIVRSGDSVGSARPGTLPFSSCGSEGWRDLSHNRPSLTDPKLHSTAMSQVWPLQGEDYIQQHWGLQLTGSQVDGDVKDGSLRFWRHTASLNRQH